MKWIKHLNIDIIRCHFNIILRIPNPRYRRLSHSTANSTSRKLVSRTENFCSAEGDNEKANTQENIWGARITRHEIHQLRNDVPRAIESERNPQQNELNNADVAIEGEHVDLPHNIIPPEENAIEQPNEIDENELLKVKNTCQCLCRKDRYSFR